MYTSLCNVAPAEMGIEMDQIHASAVKRGPNAESMIRSALKYARTV
jgi:hypothetical protein